MLKKIQGQVAEYPEDFRERNFALSFYIQETGKGTIRVYPMYEMTQDGFAVVAMTFTGATAATFRAEIIEEFNRMRSELEMRGQPTLSTEELSQRALDV